MRWFCLGLLLLSVGCGRVRQLLPVQLPPSDPRVTELLAVVAASNHTALGFSPISTNGNFRLEYAKRGGAYDRMLHIYGKTSRTLAFRQAGKGWRWIHEQEIFEGPREYATVDGTFKESICLTYETERVAGSRSTRLNVSYSGDDMQLAWPRELALVDVLPVLTAWGHNVTAVLPNLTPVNAVITDHTERRNRISNVPDDHRVVLEVESPNGIGRARLTPAVAGHWPDRIVLRLRLAALETFNVDSGSVKIHTEFQNRPPYEQATTVNITGERRITTANPYWIFVRRQRGEKLFELTLPAALLKNSPAALDFQWIDCLR
ncbi:MAG: hypothetical protein NTY53_24545 [Kiritimatiellaeota bacterium]|nr:hypothetical protein [Kiritimatiellota bacterium]